MSQCTTAIHIFINRTAKNIHSDILLDDTHLTATIDRAARGTATNINRDTSIHSSCFGKCSKSLTTTIDITINDATIRAFLTLNLHFGIALNETTLTTTIDRSLDSSISFDAQLGISSQCQSL